MFFMGPPSDTGPHMSYTLVTCADFVCPWRSVCPWRTVMELKGSEARLTVPKEATERTSLTH